MKSKTKTHPVHLSWLSPLLPPSPLPPPPAPCTASQGRELTVGRESQPKLRDPGSVSLCPGPSSEIPRANTIP